MSAGAGTHIQCRRDDQWGEQGSNAWLLNDDQDERSVCKWVEREKRVLLLSCLLVGLVQVGWDLSPVALLMANEQNGGIGPIGCKRLCCLLTDSDGAKPEQQWHNALLHASLTALLYHRLLFQAKSLPLEPDHPQSSS